MQKKKLIEIATIKNGGTPSTSNQKYYDGTISWATPKDLSDMRSKYFFEGSRNITEYGAQALGGSPIPIDSLLLTSRAPIGLMAINKKETFTNQGFKNIIPHSELNIEWLYYYLKSNLKSLLNLGGGTTFKEISKSSLDNFELILPSISEQSSVAYILSVLDKKIESNNKINAELEKLARTIYYYWFVGFNFPDENGRPYRASSGEMVYSEELKREIPKDWKVKKIRDICEVVTGKTPSTKLPENYSSKDYMFVGPEDLLNDPIGIIKTKKYISSSGFNSIYSNTVNTDSILISCIGTVGRIGFATGSFATNQQINSMTNFTNNDMSYYSYFYMKSIHKTLLNVAGNTVMPIVSKNLIENILVILPCKKIILDFKNLIQPMFSIIKKNNQENSELEKLRDWLLPMLMNGQVTIKD